MPRDVSLSDSKYWNGGQKLVNLGFSRRKAPTTLAPGESHRIYYVRFFGKEKTTTTFAPGESDRIS